MRHRLIAVIATAATALIAVAGPSNATTPAVPDLGWRWAPTTAEVTTIPVYAPIERRWGVDKAIAQWNRAGSIEFVRIDAPCRGCVTIRVGTDPAEFNRPEGKAIGLAYPTRVADGVISQCDIAVKAEVMTRKWAPAIRHGVIAHELGHCLGLDHVDDGKTRSVMYAAVGWDRPQAADLAWIRKMY